MLALYQALGRYQPSALARAGVDAQARYMDIHADKKTAM